MAGKKKKDTNFNPLSLSFLDIMSCGLGAVILIFLILKHGEAKSPEEVVRINKDISASKPLFSEQEIRANMASPAPILSTTLDA